MYSALDNESWGEQRVVSPAWPGRCGPELSPHHSGLRPRARGWSLAGLAWPPAQPPLSIWKRLSSHRAVLAPRNKKMTENRKMIIFLHLKKFWCLYVHVEMFMFWIYLFKFLCRRKEVCGCAEHWTFRSAHSVLNLTAAASVRSHQSRRLFINTLEKTWLKQKSCLWGLLLEVVSILQPVILSICKSSIKYYEG